MKKIIRIEQLNSDVFNLTWIINNICPNSCSYCPENLHNGSNHNYEWKNVQIFLKELSDRYGKIRCSIGGGEPTMSPFLYDMISMINDLGGLVTITSNGYRTPEYWKDIAPKINWLGFSYHPEFSTERYFENLDTVKYLTQVSARVMMLSSHWDQCVEVYERLRKDSYYITSAVRITNWLGNDNNGTDQYTSEQLQWFYNLQTDTKNKYKHIDSSKFVYFPTRAYMSDNSSEIIRDATLYINNKQTLFKGYTCEIGIKSMYVNQFGNIKRGNCNEGGIIGNINNPNEINWPTEPVTCSYNSCDCGTDVRINKWINE